MESCRRGGRIHCGDGFRRRRKRAVVTAKGLVAIRADGNHQYQRDKLPEQARSRRLSCVFARRPTHGGAIRAADIHGARFAVLAEIRLEAQALANVRAIAIAREFRNVNKDVRPAFVRGNEPEAAVVIPFGQLALGAHGEGFVRWVGSVGQKSAASSAGWGSYGRAFGG